MAKDEKITSSPNKAGGFGALKSSLKHVARQGDAVKTSKALWNVNQPDGFDCPGCAWPDPEDAPSMEFCENGVKAVAWETTGRRVGPDFFAQQSVADLKKQTDFYLEDQGRLTHPMRYDAATDHYVEATWQEAFELIGSELRALVDPNQAIFYTSGRTSNEAAFLYQLFARSFGTNNLPDCSNMCHESSGVALNETIGIGKGTVLLEDFEKADAILIVGQNPGTNHPRMLATLQAAARRGAEIISINPLKEAALVTFAHPKEPLQLMGAKTSIATQFFQPVIGGDLALFHGVAKWILENAGEKIAREFIEEQTSGFEDFSESIRQLDWKPITEQSGVSLNQIEQLARTYCSAERVIICWAMGLTQHKHAVATIQAISNLLLLCGNIGKPGAGACPVRGHSNVQGDRTVGITEQPKKDFLDQLGKRFSFTPPQSHGLDVVGAINAMASGEAKVFIGMGGNFASATPDSEHTQQALGKCSLTVHISTKLNRSHLTTGKSALILPCLGRTEQDFTGDAWQRVTVEDSMSMVHASVGKAQPASEHLRSEPAIVAGMAKAALQNSAIDWDRFLSNYDLIRDDIEAVIPGFDNYNEKIKQPGGFHLRNSAREWEWNTATEKARFVFEPIPDLTLPSGQFRFMTIRSHDQFNTTVYGMDDRYRGVYGTRHVIFMNESDMAEESLRDGDMVRIESISKDGIKREVTGFRVVKYDIPKGCAAGYFPETNPLISVGEFALKSRTPVSKFVPILVEKE